MSSSILSSASIRPPQSERRSSSRVPGGFDAEEEEDDMSPASSDHELNEHHNESSWSRDPGDSSGLLPVPGEDRDNSTNDLPQPLERDNNVNAPGNMTLEENTNMDGPATVTLDESDMNNKLLEVESSFLPERSQFTGKDSTTAGADDTHLFGIPNHNLAVRKKPQPIVVSYHSDETENHHHARSRSTEVQQSPRTPPGGYKTPAPERQDFADFDESDGNTPQIPNTSALENMSSSPTAAAAARTLNRVQSLATMGGYETANEQDYDSGSERADTGEEEDPDLGEDGHGTDVSGSEKQQAHSSNEAVVDADATPRRDRSQPRQENQYLNVPGAVDGQQERADSKSDPNSKRPQYLHKRSSQARLSYDSMASSNTDASEVTLGADFALQSGGALPESDAQRKSRLTISRQASLGSMMSGISGISDESQPQRHPSTSDLGTVQEESPRSSKGGGGLATPRASTFNFNMPTDTVIANNVRDLEVPGTFARQYRQERSMSPDKNSTVFGMTPGPKRGLTLKEHRSTVEKLGKENFDLKMKIHFLDQALQKRSEDGIKEMITENVQLKSDRLRLEKDNHNLRKQVRELQKKLEESGARESPNGDPGYETDEDRSPTAEEEVIYLRERVEMNEVEIEKLRSENFAKESEKRRLAEMVKSLGDTRAATSDVGSREERDMWKDMLEAETIAREQSEEDNKRLREEIAKLRSESLASGKSNSRKSRLAGSVVSRSSSVETAANAAQAAEIERLRHEVSELQKMIGAQASTLTSRNKEKERLYQEIEDLKLGRMGGLRSVAGDSILDRSASRARSHSRASNGTRVSRLDDEERETLENRINELRDEVSQLKLENQNLQSQFDEALAELDAVDAQAQADADQFNEELQLLTQERDNALREAEEQDQAFQQLKNEAQEEIDGLGDELDAKVEECARLQQELQAQIDNVKALQSEMRSASEGLVRLEEDAQQNLARYQSVKAELDESNREIESLEKSLAEAESKVQRLTVQQESSHNEIAFLREEQDSDKIKIGDLESLLKKVHLNLESERDKSRELERRLHEERAQREAVASQEKQEVQRVINDLNREAAGAKDELRKVRKALSSRDIEANAYKDRLAELEESLRNIIGDPAGSRSSLISAVTKMRRELDQATMDLESVRRRLNESESLLADRDALLESTSHECKKLAEALEREKAGRRQDKLDFERTNKGHNSTTRALSSASARIAELEGLRQSDRKRMSQMESQLKEQLSERNQLLLTLWKRLSAMCGPDWTHNNSLINGNLPSQEVIGNMLFWPGFSRNLLLAARQVEGTLSSFKDKIKRVERELYKEYQALEQTLEVRTRKLERIEESWEQMKLKLSDLEARSGHPDHHGHGHKHGSGSSKSSRTPEISKLKGENRLLKAELQLLQQQQTHHNMHYGRNKAESRASGYSSTTVNEAQGQGQGLDGTVNSGVVGVGVPTRSSSVRRNSGRPMELQRHHSTGMMEQFSNMSGDMASLRSSSISSRNSAAYAAYAAYTQGERERDRDRDRDRQQRERDRGLMVPAGPFNAPANGNFSLPPAAPPPREAPPMAPRSTGSGSDIASITTAVSVGGGQQGQGQGQGSEKWIHRLRELERRLKAEREARLLDRSGARKRLEERDAVNEELRRELERERVKKSFVSGGELQQLPGYPSEQHIDAIAQGHLEEGGRGGDAHNSKALEDGSLQPFPAGEARATEVEAHATGTQGPRNGQRKR
ncbi:Anucleate primary sterigmata protein B [Exophiala dermatitidis]